MSIAYKPRGEDNKLVPTKDQKLGDLLADHGLDGQLAKVALYNWGTKEPAEINRALVELVGCSKVDDDPLESLLDPARGGTKAIHEPVPWTAEVAFEKVHTVKVKKRLPATAVAITELTPFFDPESASCTIKVRYEGAAARATKRAWEVHATSYYASEDAVDLGTGAQVLVDKPCGTDDADDLTRTHLVCKVGARAPGEETLTWDGTSDATEGVLKNPAKINSRCAPYVVMVRYYEDDADKEARLLLEPFYPRWKLVGKARRELVEASLVVTWKLTAEESSKAKLVRGHLEVHDSTGKPVFFAPLTKEQLAAGKYDLLNGAVKWEKAKVDPKKMPYRVQIQAHSDEDEDKGLGLAAMPTQVPAYAYEQVQLIGFNVRNDTKTDTKYLGWSTANVDILERGEVMIEAVQIAHGKASTDRKILKVFVAPEFYWRGRRGAYLLEDISKILPSLRVEADKAKYVDWLFVFGTAIGQLVHKDGGDPIKHGKATHWLEIVSVDTATKITAKLPVPLGATGWAFKQGGTTTKVTAVANTGTWDDVNKLYTWVITLATTIGFIAGDAELLEPDVTIADVWPMVFKKSQILVKSPLCKLVPVDPGTGDVLSVGGEQWKVVSEGVESTITRIKWDEDKKGYWVSISPSRDYEAGKPIELIEPIATEIFNVALLQKGWCAPHLGDGDVRERVVYKENISPIDFLRNKKLKWHDPKGTNRKITIDGKKGVPALPTDGSKDLLGVSPNVTRDTSTGVGSEISASGLGGGTVFTMDGVTFGVEVCLDHAKDRLWSFCKGPNKRAGDPKVQVQLIPSWGMSIGGSNAGKEVSTVDDGLVFNVDGARMESVARLWDGVYSCDDHPTKTGVSGDTCDCHASYKSAGVELFTCSNASHGGKGELTPCTAHGKTTSCDADLQALGTQFAPSSTDDVPLSDNTMLFVKKGNVQVFPPKDLPDPDLVT
jgi:hypothetical protein